MLERGSFINEFAKDLCDDRARSRVELLEDREQQVFMVALSRAAMVLSVLGGLIFIILSVFGSAPLIIATFATSFATFSLAFWWVLSNYYKVKYRLTVLELRLLENDSVA